MFSEIFKYSKTGGWSVPEFPDLDSGRTLVMVFASPSLCEDEKPFKELSNYYQLAHIVGCSTAGEICGEELNDDSLSVAVIQFGYTDIKTVYTAVAGPQDSAPAAVRLAKQLQGETLRAVFVLSDGLNVNGSQLIQALNAEFPINVSISGGLAADGSNFGKTFVIREGRPATGTIAAVGLYGSQVRVGCGSQGGWDRFGHERIVTSSKDNVLYELDGQPALDTYKDYLGEQVADLPASALLYPLAVWETGQSNRPLVRTILSINEDEKSMTFAGDIPEGSSAQFLFGNRDRLIDGASLAAQEAGLISVPDAVAIGISCVGRRLVLKDRTEEEIESTVAALSDTTKLVGFYSYGEISPIGKGPSDLHNQSMTITVISEAA